MLETQEELHISGKMKKEARPSKREKLVKGEKRLSVQQNGVYLHVQLMYDFIHHG